MLPTPGAPPALPVLPVLPAPAVLRALGALVVLTALPALGVLAGVLRATYMAPWWLLLLFIMYLFTLRIENSCGKSRYRW